MRISRIMNTPPTHVAGRGGTPPPLPATSTRLASASPADRAADRFYLEMTRICEIMLQLDFAVENFRFTIAR